MILLRSDIRLTTSDIRYASFVANRISLKPQALISLSHKRQYHSAFAEYHYIYLTYKSKFEQIIPPHTRRDEDLFNYFDLFDNNGNSGNVVVPAAAAGLYVCDLVNNVDTLDHLAKSGVLTVEMGSIAVHDKELRGS